MSFLLDRGDGTEVSEAEERELRESLTDWMVASGIHGRTLHIPHDIENEQPLGQRVRRNGATWIEKPVETYPVGHTEVCLHCAERFFRQREQGIR